MFAKKDKPEPSALENAIEDALVNLSPHDDDYTEKVQAVERLYKLKEIDSPQRVSPDSIALIIGHLTGIAMIVGYERANVVTSKAVGFVKKLL